MTKHYSDAQAIIADAMHHLNGQLARGLSRSQLDANCEAWQILLSRKLALMTTPTTPHPLSKHTIAGPKTTTTPTPPHPLPKSAARSDKHKGIIFPRPSPQTPAKHGTPSGGNAA